MAQQERETITIQPRNTFGKTNAKRARKNGMIPIVLTSHGQTESYFLDGKDVKNFTDTSMSESILWNFVVAGQEPEKVEVFIKDYQINRLTDEVLHLDFFKITRGEKIHTNVPLVYEGTPVGTKMGGIVETFLEEVEVMCLPKDLPNEIVIDISQMELNDALHLENLPVLEGVEYTLGEDTVLLSIGVPKAVETEESEDEEERDVMDVPLSEQKGEKKEEE